MFRTTVGSGQHRPLKVTLCQSHHKAPGRSDAKLSLAARLPPSIQKQARESNWKLYIDRERLFVSLCDPAISCGLVVGVAPPSPEDSREKLQQPLHSQAALLHDHEVSEWINE